MRKLILAGAVLALAGSTLAGITCASARGGFHGHSHGHIRHGGLRPAKPIRPAVADAGRAPDGRRAVACARSAKTRQSADRFGIA